MHDYILYDIHQFSHDHWSAVGTIESEYCVVWHDSGKLLSCLTLRRLLIIFLAMSEVWEGVHIIFLEQCSVLLNMAALWLNNITFVSVAIVPLES